MPQSKRLLKRFLIVAGGTGGHILPGLALAQELSKQGKKVSILSLARNRDYADLQGLEHLSIHFYKAPPIPAKTKVIACFAFFYKFLFAIIQALILLKKERIDSVIGMGGYSMAPAIIASFILGIPYSLCEQNVIPGLALRLFTSRAKNVFINFPFPFLTDRLDKTKKTKNKSTENIKKLKLNPEKIHIVGNPLRERILSEIPNKKIKIDRKHSLKKLQVLVLGGSQGALQINEIITKAVPILGESFEWWLQCGVNNLKSMEQALPRSNYPNLRLIAYTPAIEKFYQKANLIICRAGAGVISEALCFGLPLVLIPYPYAADAHQEANANYCVKAGAALLCKQRDTKAAQLVKILKDIHANQNKLARMALAGQKISRPHAARDITSYLLK